ncbi:uncharacterized protein LOC141660535 [Apium graveolens]|uniref:uncharacterized protein LOC141660535 n=1 Tax=Apium graveolens TaxID=4045 RepID=UPI003D7AA30F
MELCKIVYGALDSSTTALLESMCQGKLMEKDGDQCWEFFEESTEKTMLWESNRDLDKQNETLSSLANKGFYLVGNSVAIEAKLATLTRRLEALEITSAPSQVSMCANPNSSNNGVPNYHYVKQINVMFQPTSRNDPLL